MDKKQQKEQVEKLKELAKKTKSDELKESIQHKIETIGKQVNK